MPSVTVRQVVEKGETTYTLADVPKNLAQDAMFGQSAPNGVALVNAMQRAMKTLREQFPNRGGDWYNQHPIMTMFLVQLSHLNFGRTPEHPQMFEIWNLVEEASNS